ncbi:hypothetical protein [Schlesneria paludicola]|uniref:hypothetical protein n=1 Tax=Schlesneria paludicola TaxID=360056 RepID=UPI00029A2D4F|nr:hypothetical protein [Schlesneria paludicola]
MTASSFAEMKAAGKRRVVPFTGLEEFGLTLYCCSITEQESANQEAASWKPGTIDIDPHRLKSARRKLIAMTVSDEEGNRLLNEEQAAELDSVLAGILYEQAAAHTSLRMRSKNLPSASGEQTPIDSRSSADGPTSTSSSTN